MRCKRVLRSKGLFLGVLASVFASPLGACIDVAQAPVEVPLMLAGQAQSQISLATGQIELSSAQVAFGPLYLCAGASAGDLCQVARAEWLDTAVVDILDPTPVRVGTLRGNSGTVLSWMYDLGISSHLTQSKPFVLPAAQRLGGASLLVTGRARVQEFDIPFSAAVAVAQTQDTELGVPVVRKSGSERFFRDLGESQDLLLVRFDPAALFASMDLNHLIQRAACSPDSSTRVCDGATERTCKDGVQVAAVDCAAMGQVCAPNLGCVQRIEIDPSSEMYRVLRASMLSGARPSMEWSTFP